MTILSLTTLCYYLNRQPVSKFYSVRALGSNVNQFQFTHEASASQPNFLIHFPKCGKRAGSMFICAEIIAQSTIVNILSASTSDVTWHCRHSNGVSSDASVGTDILSWWLSAASQRLAESGDYCITAIRLIASRKLIKPELRQEVRAPPPEPLIPDPKSCVPCLHSPNWSEVTFLQFLFSLAHDIKCQ